jgi:uncharacterized protein with PIN domain
MKVHSEEQERCPECQSLNIQEQIEEREGGYFETIIYCLNCGATQS